MLNAAPLFLLAILLSGCGPAGPRALLQGEKLVEQGRYSEAVEKLKRATTLLSTNADAWNYLGLAYHYGGQPAEAEKAYQRALLFNHDLSEAHLNLGCVWLEQNKPEAARNEFLAYTLRRGNSPDVLIKLGFAQMRSRELAAADKTFAEALRLSPQNSEALNGLGMLRAHQRRVPEALQIFKLALKQHPNFAPAMLNEAILTQQSDRAAALVKYRQYLALKPAPENAEAVGAVVRQLEEELNLRPRPVAATNGTSSQAVVVPRPPSVTNAPLVQSRPQLTKQVKPTPVNNVAKPVSNVTAQPAPREKVDVETIAPEPAVKPAQELKLAAAVPAPTPPPKEPPAKVLPGRYAYRYPAKPALGNRTEAEKLFAQGSQAQQANRLSDAVAIYKKATELDPGYFEAQYNLALTAAEAGNLPTSLLAQEMALAIQPESLEARYNFALILKQAGYLQDAASELEKLLAKYPNEGRAHLMLANIYDQNLHDPVKARPHYLNVLNSDPGNPQASNIRYWLAEHPQ